MGESDFYRNEPLLNEGMATEPRRRPLPTEGYLWLAWHRARLHDVEPWGYSIGPRGGSRRNWFCLTCHRTWR